MGVYKAKKQKKFKGFHNVGSYIQSGLSLSGLKDYYKKVWAESGGKYGQGPGTYDGVRTEGFLNWGAKKKVQKEYKKTAEYKTWKKAGGTAVRTKGYDAEGNRVVLGEKGAIYDRRDAWLDEMKQGFSRGRNAAFKKAGLGYTYDDYNAADRWFEDYSSKLSKEDAIASNPYGKGNVGYDTIRDRYDANRTKKTSGDDGGSKSSPSPKTALARSAAKNTTTIVTPKEIVKRKVVPQVSARIKQKSTNLRAGIRT